MVQRQIPRHDHRLLNLYAFHDANQLVILVADGDVLPFNALFGGGMGEHEHTAGAVNEGGLGQ